MSTLLVNVDRSLRVAFRSTLRTDRVVGTFISISNPTVVEILGRCGFELVCIDSEHGAFGPVEVQELIRAAASVDTPALVRVSEIGPEIGRALDSGAVGVIVPRVETAEQAQAVVDAVRYPPTGSRGAGPGRATAYGLDFAGYLARADDEVAAIVQVETVAGVENVEAILAVPGIDMVFVGPGDLAVSLGFPGGSPEHTAAIRRIIDAARAASVPVGIFTLTVESMRNWVTLGVTFFLLSGDLAMLAQQGTLLATNGRAEILAEVTA